LNARLEGENELRVERDAVYRDLVMEGPRFMELTERACEWKERCEAALLSVKRLERDLNDAKKLEEMNDPRAIDERSMNDR